jgi:tetratricopeptide (TPR) repeat protein
MANLELKKYSEAIDAFGQVIAANAKSGDNYFQDEAEYYLALAYLASNQATKAMPLLEKIRADKNHLYNEKVNTMSSIDFGILRYKTGK